MIVRYSFTCPHCSFKQLHEIDLEDINSLPTSKQIVTNCDSETGGCDEPVAVFITICPEAIAYKIDKKGS